MATCHSTGGMVAPVAPGVRNIVLAGNPNVGKSVVFNALTGTYVDVSNFPGTTVEVTRGAYEGREVIDTPGVYGVSSFNDEEAVARDVILTADVVVNVVDAVHLERDLFLTLQLLDMGLPVVVSLNMVDEARRQGVAVDRDLLEDLLGVPVVETVAVKGVGLQELKATLAKARPGRGDRELDAELAALMSRGASRPEALMALEDDEVVLERLGLPAQGMREGVYLKRRERVNDVVRHVVRESTVGAGLAARLSHWMMQPVTGIPMMLGLLFVMYEVIGVGVAGKVVGLTENWLMKGYWEPFARGLVGRVLDSGSAPYTFLAGQFGVLTMTPTYLIGVILPLVTAFYLLLALLEDSGYLPRIAALSDRALSAMGLNGRAVIPLILGLGCVTMATLTTRILGSKRERFIATALMAIAVPCSAQIAVIAALMTRVGGWYSLAYLASIALVFVLVGTALEKLTPGASTDLLIDLPPLRVPIAANVVRKTGIKVWGFMREVSLFFLGGAVLMSLLQVSGALVAIQDFATPLTVGWLHLPPEAARAFVMGFVRRDFGAAGFFTMALSARQLLVAMVTITIFVPCIASVMVIAKERGPRYVTGLLVSSVTIAFLAGGLLTRLLEAI